MKVTPKYSPLEKVELISGTQWWVNSITIYAGYYIYNIWDGRSTFLNVDEEHIARSLVQNKTAGFSIKIKSPK